MTRTTLALLSLLLSLPAAADPLSTATAGSLFTAPLQQAAPSERRLPRWLVAPAAQAAPAATEEPGSKKLTSTADQLSKISYGVGLQGRGIFVPEWFLGTFLDQTTGLYSGAIGAEFVRRKGNFDLVGTINFNFYDPPDGNFLGNGKPPVDIDYVRFNGLHVMAFEVDFIWHHNFNEWLSLVYGAGLGFGVVLGSVDRVSVHGERLRDGSCNSSNPGDLGNCNPVHPNASDAAEQLKVWNNDPNDWLDKYSSECPGQASDNIRDPGDPEKANCWFEEDDVWPVVPMVHLLIGLNFKINKEFNIRVDTGWHNAFYVGATTHWFFF